MTNRFLKSGWLLMWLAPVMTGLAIRGPIPIDETRYLAVAWEMWSRGSFIVPLLNAMPYSHKPPLLFWLMHAGWWLTGVSALWPRLIPGLCALACLFLTRRLSLMLWPHEARTADTVAWVLAGSLAWGIWGQMLLFDMLVAVFVLLAVSALWGLGQRNALLPWLVVGLSMGLGILAKGPVMLVYTVLPAALASTWSATARREPLRWYAGLVAAVLVAAAVALAWALPAARIGGQQYADAILWHQTADRMAESFAHARPWWTYLWVFPALLMPWLVVPAAWARPPPDPGASRPTRFLVAWLGSVLFVMSVISAKQPHYLLPVVPAAALLLARQFAVPGAVSRRRGFVAAGGMLAAVGLAVGLALYREQVQTGPDNVAAVLLLCGAVVAAGSLLAGFGRVQAFVESVAAATALTVCLLIGAFTAHYGAGFDLRPTAEAISLLQRSGGAVASDGGFHGQFNFLGRLASPITELTRDGLPEWALQHPGGYLIGVEDNMPSSVHGAVVHRHRYRRHWLVIWKLDPVAAVSMQPGAPAGKPGTQR